MNHAEIYAKVESESNSKNGFYPVCRDFDSAKKSYKACDPIKASHYQHKDTGKVYAKAQYSKMYWHNLDSEVDKMMVKA